MQIRSNHHYRCYRGHLFIEVSSPPLGEVKKTQNTEDAIKRCSISARKDSKVSNEELYFLIRKTKVYKRKKPDKSTIRKQMINQRKKMFDALIRKYQ